MTQDAYELEGSDLVLLLLNAPTRVPTAQGRINGITRLEKLLFLAEKEGKVEEAVAGDRLKFVAYNYGPFSKDVYEAVEILEKSGLIMEERAIDGQTIDSVEDVEVTGAFDGDEYVERRFAITSDGQAVANLLGRHHPTVVDTLAGIKDRYADRALSSLIRYVYRTYPESAEKSLIRDRHL